MVSYDFAVFCAIYQNHRGVFMQFSLRFKQLCKENGVTQKQALADMGMGRNSAQSWINGSPSLETLQKIADYFGIDPTIVRLILIVLVITGFGTGVVIYIVGAVIMPERSLDDENLRSANVDNKENSTYTSTDEDKEFDSHFKK